MINFAAVYFSECRSKEVTSFFLTLSVHVGLKYFYMNFFHTTLTQVQRANLNVSTFLSMMTKKT